MSPSPAMSAEELEGEDDMSDDGGEDGALATANDPTVLPLPIDDGWGINTRLEFPNHSKIDEQIS